MKPLTTSGRLEAYRLFRDQLVSVTDLSRQSGKVLDLALEAPVTITRGNQYFALLRRAQAASLLEVAHNANTLVDVIEACRQRLAGEPPPEDDEFAWLDTLDNDERFELIRVSLESFRATLAGSATWADFADTINRWKEGALAASRARCRRQSAPAWIADPETQALPRV